MSILAIFRYLVLACLYITPVVYAKHSVTIYTEQFPPYNFSNKGYLEGINLRFVRAMCVDADIECRFVLLPWSRAYHLAQEEPMAGLVSTARIPDREPLFNWVGPMASSRNYFYRLKSNPQVNPRDLSEVKDYTLGVVRDSIYEQFVENIGFENEQNLLKFSHYYECINLFFKGKLDLIIGSELSFHYQLMQYGYAGQEVVKLIELPLNDTTGNFLALNKNMPKEIVEQFQNSYQKLMKQGKLDKLINEYLVSQH
ncbi:MULTISPECIES: transporter substrate-binding domain-containing protein [unclassified Pseudoalteromonas]|uniref:substrate-binding periplasmic protein n=1 Tax=unclassified Pseudoalteromonas TaxID=194690 RepID=UPI001F379922|nr:transporter substrate-binding domain-containing protein [Pseudoalteromonas sp. L1]WOC28103.1 transporter substrate-binding domain-containing protein [Pseudoalteromonas sp. N1230-9]